MPAEKVPTKSDNRRTSKSSKLEKADILEMAVRHLQNLQLQKPTSVSATTTSSEDELGVHHHQQQQQPQQNKYRAGYNECAKEVSRFLDTVDGIDSSVRGRLIAHLLNCLNEMSSSESTTINKGNNNNNNNNNKHVVPPTRITAKADDDDSGRNKPHCNMSMDMEPSSSDDTSVTSPSLSPVSSSSVVECSLPVTSTSSIAEPIHIHIPATSIPFRILSSNGHHHHHQERGNSPKHSTVASSSATYHGGLQLIPTRLSTGEFAFVVPNSHSCSPIPTISATVSSSSSSSVSLSSISSQPQSLSQNSGINPLVPHSLSTSSSCSYSKCNKPIPLVLKDEPVWRPW